MTSAHEAKTTSPDLDLSRLLTVAQLAQRTPLSEGAWRWLLFHRETNGLTAAGVVVRVGRKILLDLDRVKIWLESNREAA